MNNYYEVKEGSHFFSSIDQIYNYALASNNNLLAEGIRNSIKRGYKLVKDEKEQVR